MDQMNVEVIYVPCYILKMSLVEMYCRGYSINVMYIDLQGVLLILYISYDCLMTTLSSYSCLKNNKN